MPKARPDPSIELPSLEATGLTLEPQTVAHAQEMFVVLGAAWSLESGSC
jgi:hypothetical protein